MSVRGETNKGALPIPPWLPPLPTLPPLPIGVRPTKGHRRGCLAWLGSLPGRCSRPSKWWKPLTG